MSPLGNEDARARYGVLVILLVLLSTGILIVVLYRNSKLNTPTIQLEGRKWHCTQERDYAVGMAVGRECTQWTKNTEGGSNAPATEWYLTPFCSAPNGSACLIITGGLEE